MLAQRVELRRKQAQTYHQFGAAFQSLDVTKQVSRGPAIHLPKGRGTQLRRRVAEAAGRVSLEDDFHRLVQAVAAGIGLRYRPVIYYKSRIDQKEFSFARQQVSPIHLTDRVGFAATTEPSVVVRLKRPFFFQLSNDLYYAGHAHVARG